jgi:tetratricopeptide (TPR) repeat protein
LNKELYESYPNNVEFKNNLAISYEFLGETHAELGHLDKALQFYEERARLGKELFEAIPNHVGFKNNLAISYWKLGDVNRKIQKKTPALTYFQKAEQLWKELVAMAPLVEEYKQNLRILQNNLADLQKSIQQDQDPVFQLTQRIRNEPDTLSKYKLYTTLCDSLRFRIMVDQKFKTDLADALNSKAWYGFFLKKFEAVEADIREGMALQTDYKFLATNLPPALLFQGKLEAAIAEYQKWKDKPLGYQNLPTYREAFLDDLNAFEKAGIIPPERRADVDEVRKLLMDKK